LGTLRGKGFLGGAKSSVRTPSRRQRLISTIEMIDAAVSTVSATLSLTVQTAPPSGVLVSTSGQRWTFHGWIQLANAIEQWRAAERSTDEKNPTD
jgi:hypothetical protein